VKYALLTLRVFHRAGRRLTPHTVKPVMQGLLPDWQVSALLAQVFFILPCGREPLCEAGRLPVPRKDLLARVPPSGTRGREIRFAHPAGIPPD